MATEADIVALANRMVRGDWHPDINRWPEDYTDNDRLLCMELVFYAGSRVYLRSVERKATVLLKSWLPAEARLQLAQRGEFYLTGTVGGTYRLHPRSGNTWRVQKHGTRWFAMSNLCLHDPAGELPRADIVLAHALMILTDEADFLAQANEHQNHSMMWDGEWLRRCARVRRERKL